MSMAKGKFLTTFEKFGLSFKDNETGQLVADCPFTGKKDKFYLNPETGQWDSKSSGEGGNLYTFMSKFYEECLNSTTSVELKELSESRQIPIKHLRGKIAYNGYADTYMIPEYNHKGKISGIGHYRLGSKMVARTKNTKVTLNGIQNLKGNDLPVYICEGEWDWMALQMLHKEVDYPSVCLCLPGAGTFKPEWIEHLKGKRVFCCYDNDQPGEKGEAKANKLLKGIVKSIRFLQWNELHADKYDVRDFIIDNGDVFLPTPKFKSCFKIMQGMFSENPRLIENPTEQNEESALRAEEESLTPPTLEELEQGYSKWLKMASYDPLAFMYGTCFANRIGGDPVWSFIVAPPGGSKTELLMTISKSLSVETVSTLTPASLVSGMRMPDGDDPSIIPRLDGRMLSIKDFTTILSMNAFQRDEVFGILRDIYDGSIEKPFGNGLVRRYESLFGILAGVTPTIDTFQSVHSALGERFIKYRLDIDILPEAEEERLRKVLMNISHESNMRGELQELGRRMLSKKIDPTKLPEFDEETAEVIMKCARYTAKLRSSVDRDKYTNVLTSIPTTEIATRLTKQFMKLALGVAIYYGDAVVGENSLRILRKVCIDTAPSMEEACIQVIYKEWKNNGGEPVCVSDILHKFPYCKATLHKVANDMVTLKILKQVTVDGQRMKSFFEPSKNLISMIKGAGLY